MADFTKEEVLALAAVHDNDAKQVSAWPKLSAEKILIATALHALAKSMDAEPAGWLTTATAKWLAEYDGSACAVQTAVHNRPIKTDGGVPFYFAPPASAPAEPVAEDWRDDPAQDERWNEGVDFAITQLCKMLGVDPMSIRWDAATETVDGDVSSVVGNVLRAAYSEEWSSAAETTAHIRSALAEQPAPVAETGAARPIAWRYRYNGEWYVCNSEEFARKGLDAAPLFLAPPARESTAARDVLVERERQIEIEGWSAERDNEYTTGQLADAASCYALSNPYPDHERGVPADWPWSRKWWKPTTRRRDLVKAGALIIAEIERLDRLTASQNGEER